MLCPTAQSCTGGTLPGREVSNQGGYNRNGSGTPVYDFWRVTSQDGTVYRLGARHDSEQRKDRVCIWYAENYDRYNPHSCGEHGGDLLGRVVWRWRVDLVTDVYGNEMVYQYVETTAAQQGYKDTWSDRTEWDRESYLDYVGWNWRPELGTSGWWGYVVRFGLVCRANAPSCSSYEPTQINDATDSAAYGENGAVLWFQRKVLQAITVTQMTSASAGVAIREYRLAYTTSGTRNEPNQLPSRVLASITPYGLNGYPGGLTLPATAFTYVAKDNQGSGDECYTNHTYPYGRLSEIANGYGATISLTYDNDRGAGCDRHDVKVRNWFLVRKTVQDGLTPALVNEYALGRPCYAQPPYAAACRSTNNTGFGSTSLVGYGIVTETVRSGSTSGPIMAQTEHHFVPDAEDWGWTTEFQEFSTRLWALVGREKLTRQFGADGVVLAETRQVYTNTVLIDQTGNDPTGKPKPDALFNHLDETIQSTFSPTGTLRVRTRTATVYETTYGKPIVQYNYGATQVLVNEGFEGALTAGRPSGWDWYQPGGGNFTTTLTTTAKVLGNVSLALQHLDTSTCECGLSQGVTAAQGAQTYTGYRVYARVRGGGPISPTFKLLVWDGVNGGNMPSVTPALTQDWQLVTVAFTTTNTAQLRIRVQLTGGQAGAVLVDDVWWERASEMGDEQAQKTGYNANTTKWIVVPRSQRVFTGTAYTDDSTTGYWTGSEASMTTFGYDGGEPVFGTIISGALTSQRQYLRVNSNWRYDYGYMITTTFGYDTYGNQTWAKDARGYTSYTAYDPLYHMYPMTFTNALSRSNYLGYNFALGKVLTATNANGVSTGVGYDVFGRVITVTEDGDTAALPTVRYYYTDTYTYGGFTGLSVKTVFRETSGSGTAVKEQYDFYTGRGLLVQTRGEIGTGSQQAVGNTRYDALGRVITGYIPITATTVSANFEAGQLGPAYTLTQYDALGRTVIVTATDDSQTRTFYDGLTTTVVDANSHQKVSLVDAYGRLVTVKEYTGQYPSTLALYATTAYAYNVLGNLIRVNDAAGKTTTMSYDPLGRKLTMNDPNMGAWHYAYDAAGNLIEQFDAHAPPNGWKTCFSYDALGRLLGKKYDGSTACPAAFTDQYAYDQSGHGYAVGQRTMMTSTAAIVSWTYDRRGRVTAETRSVPGMGVYTFRFTHDTAGRVVSTTYPTGEVVTNTYTAAWEPKTLSSAWRTYISDATYNVRGQLLTRNANTLLTTYKYWGDYGEALGQRSYRLKELKVGTADLLQLGYLYDAVGNVARITDTVNSGQVQSFYYDELDRLTIAGTSAAGQGQYYDTYSYGKMGTFTSYDGRTYVATTDHLQQIRYSDNLGAGGLFNDFSVLTTTWALCGACGVTTLAGEPVLHNPSPGGTTVVTRTAANLGDGDVAQVEFSLASTAESAQALLAIETTNREQHFGLVVTGSQVLRVERKVTVGGTPSTYYASLSPSLSLVQSRWYVLRLAVAQDGKFKAWVWERDNPAARGYYEVSPPVQWQGQSWRFYQESRLATEAWLDSYFEIQSGGSVFAYRYDDNGNMLARTEMGVGYTQAWDAQNRLIGVTYGMTGTTQSYSFAYDADGARAKQVAPGGYPTAYAGGGLYEETVTPTLLLDENFTGGAGNWTPSGGTWQVVDEGGNKVYKQTNTKASGEASSVRTGASHADITATVRVRIDGGTTALAGLVLRRPADASGGYFLALRNSAAGGSYYCGIYEKVSGNWVLRTPGLTSCKVAVGGWHTLEARAIGGRVEMWMDGALQGTWVDATPQNFAPAGVNGFGVQTYSGTASFDDVKVAGVTSRSYYVFGAARVAMRTTSAALTASAAQVLYLHGDHLGSVSIATKTNGDLVGTSPGTRYYPFGDVRVSGSLPTDFGFTGERNTSYIKLLAIGARWLDPALGRWLSPDTIVPDPANPQSLNRYTYVRNDPVARLDPTGHRDCEESDHEACSYGRSADENVYARALLILRLYGGTNDLEGLAQISDLVASYFPGKEEYVGAMNRLLLGTDTTGVFAARDAAAEITSGSCAGLGWEPGDCPRAKHYWGDTGFHPDFRDGHNQLFHVWAFVAETASGPWGLGALGGHLAASYANVDHEIGGSIRDEIKSSWQDYYLSAAGAYLGDALNVGAVAPADVGDYMRNNWGPGGPGTYGLESATRAIYGPLYGETHPVDVWNIPVAPGP